MSLLPQRMVNGFRQFSDLSVEAYGMPCVLYIPSNLTTVLVNDVYTKPSDYTFTKYDTKVWIEWSPNKYQLSKLGMYTENELPMLAYFSNVLRTAFQSYDDLDITIGSYFTIDIQYITQFDKITNEFDIVDVRALGMRDKLALKVFKIVPRRVKNT